MLFGKNMHIRESECNHTAVKKKFRLIKIFIGFSHTDKTSHPIKLSPIAFVHLLEKKVL